MKIVAGLGSIDEYITFVNAGADEFFAGYIPYEWMDKYGMIMPLNRREVVSYHVQIGSFSELNILRKMTDKYRKETALTFNSLYYIPEQYSMIADIFEKCIGIGFDSFIIADPALFLYIRNQGLPCKIQLSGECAEVNTPMVKMFQEYGLDRVIFHRKNTICDMKSIIEKCNDKTKEFEAFALNEMCHYTGAFCNSLHCDEMSHICQVNYKVSGENGSQVYVTEKYEDDEEYVTGSTGCGMCALFALRAAGVTHLKLVGRGNHTDCIVRDIAVLRKAVDILEQSDNEKEYKSKMLLEVRGGRCKSNICYYSELYDK